MSYSFKDDAFDPVSRATATLQMLVTDRSKAFVFLEGPTDPRLYRHLLRVFDGWYELVEGKDRILKVFQQLHKFKAKGALGIVDADYDHILGGTTDPDIVPTDVHDFECMVLKTKALRKVLIEYDLVDDIIDRVNPWLFKACLPLGRLRYVNHREKWGIKFDGLSIREFLDSETFTLEIAELANRLSDSWRFPSCTTAKLIELSGIPVGSPEDPWQVCCGHDLTEVLSVIISKHGRRNPSRGEIESLLRQSYEYRDFEGTAMCGSIRDWQERNIPRRLLNDRVTIP